MRHANVSQRPNARIGSALLGEQLTHDAQQHERGAERPSYEHEARHSSQRNPALWGYFAVVAAGHAMALAAAMGRLDLYGTPAADWARMLNIELGVVALCLWLDPVLAWLDRRSGCTGIYVNCDGHDVRDTDADVTDVSKILTTGKSAGA